VDDKAPPLDSAKVNAIVLKAHGDIDAVRALLEEQSALVNAAWDWGGGDWENPLGAAAHMGRRDIAELLLDRGARLDLFAAAMLGETEIVRAALAAFPGARDVRGPDGIPLIEHARKGGDAAHEVLELLESAPVAAD